MAEFNTVKQVVDGYVDKYPGQFQESDKWVLKRHALSWFNQADRLLAPARATVEIMLQSDRSADLPDDFVDWLVVGKRVGNQVVNLCFNERVNRLPPLTPTAPPTSTALLPQVLYHGYLYGELYGYGGGEYPANEFVVDTGAGKLYTNSEVEPGPLYLQYIFNKDLLNEATPIAVEYMMVLEYWLEWQFFRRAPDAQRLRAQYYQELKQVDLGANAGNLASWYDLFDNRAYGQI